MNARPLDDVHSILTSIGIRQSQSPATFPCPELFNIALYSRKVVKLIYFIPKIHTSSPDSHSSANIRPQSKATLLTTLAAVMLQHSLTRTGKSEIRPIRRVGTSARVRDG